MRVTSSGANGKHHRGRPLRVMRKLPTTTIDFAQLFGIATAYVVYQLSTSIFPIFISSTHSCKVVVFDLNKAKSQIIFYPIIFATTFYCEKND